MEARSEEPTTADIAQPQAAGGDLPPAPSSPDDQPTGSAATDASQTPLLDASEGGTFRQRWTDIQVAFVDRPRDSVADADKLVAELMQRLATMFNDERSTLESQWEQGQDVSTEDLRVALKRYRSFFDRLLSV